MKEGTHDPTNTDSLMSLQLSEWAEPISTEQLSYYYLYLLSNKATAESSLLCVSICTRARVCRFSCVASSTTSQRFWLVSFSHIAPPCIVEPQRGITSLSFKKILSPPFGASRPVRHHPTACKTAHLWQDIFYFFFARLCAGKPLDRRQLPSSTVSTLGKGRDSRILVIVGDNSECATLCKMGQQIEVHH